MGLQFIIASTSDALTLNGISKRSFDSDIEVGGSSIGGPPGYMSVQFHTKMAGKQNIARAELDGYPSTRLHHNAKLSILVRKDEENCYESMRIFTGNEKYRDSRNAECNTNR